ncbi:MAG: amino acid permease [Gammaproteobacteria bacterium]|nr:MAG: amino acid permease [Gammaproteobacteria bacterium]
MLLGLRELVLHPAAYVAHVPPNPAAVSEVLRASTIALFAMLGIECAMIPADRVRDPARTIPRATLTGTLLVALIYICISVIPMLLIPQPELVASNAPFADLFSRLLGSGSGRWVAAFVIISGLGALNGWTLILGQLTQTLAKHGSFPAALGKVNTHAAPARAFVLTGAAASLMLLMNYNQSMAGTFTFLSVVVTAANLPLYIACSLAVLVLWRRGELVLPGSRAWTWFAAALLATGYCIGVFIGVGTKSLLWAIALGAAGVPVHLWYRRRRANGSSDSTGRYSVAIREEP